MDKTTKLEIEDIVGMTKLRLKFLFDSHLQMEPEFMEWKIEQMIKDLDLILTLLNHGGTNGL